MENIGYNGKIHIIPPAACKNVSNQEMRIWRDYILNLNTQKDLTIVVSLTESK